MSSIEETNTAFTTTSTTVKPTSEAAAEVKTETPVVSNPFAGLTAASPASNAISKEEEGEGEENEVNYKLKFYFNIINSFI